VNGHQYLRELGVTTGFVQAPEGTLQHERELLDFYLYIVKDSASVHDQMYSFLTSKVSIAKIPTVIHCTGFASYAFSRNLPVKNIFWLHATLEDRVERLLARHKLTVDESAKAALKEKLQVVDTTWEDKLQSTLGINMREVEKNSDTVIDTANMTAEQAFQRLATIDSFIDTYNSLASIMPDFHHEWRRWKCLNCQLVLETNKIVTTCPRCKNNNPDRFVDLD
jgi:rubrerythrin